MKLYATVTSERASKGQGGNKKMEILLQVDPKLKAQIGRVVMEAHEDGYIIKYFPISGAAFRATEGKNVILLLDTTSSRSQVPFQPRCSHCGSSMTELVEEWVCDNDSCGWNLEKVKGKKLKTAKCEHKNHFADAKGFECSDCGYTTIRK